MSWRECSCHPAYLLACLCDRNFTLAPISLEALISVHSVSWISEGQAVVAVGPAGALIVFGPEVEDTLCHGVV